ncbi:MAG: DUF349 domain-containing protein [Erysipelotrichaceae bacterium]|nr:DUF349 domain-containing protein [Erysipelotrichaceae bacterium]
MDWRTLPGFDEKYSRITIKEHKTFGGKTIEVLYGAQDENGNPVAPREVGVDGCGRWFGIESNGEYTMFSWQHPACDGGALEFGTDLKDDALQSLEDDMRTKYDLVREAEEASKNASEDAQAVIDEVRSKLDAMKDWRTNKEEEYKERLGRALSRFENSMSHILFNKEQKEKIVEEAKALSESTSWKSAQQGFRELREDWKELGYAGNTNDELWDQFKSFEKQFNENRRNYFDHLDEIHAAAAEAKEKLVAEAREVASNVKNWKSAGDKMNELMEQWKAAGRAGRETDDSLWEQFSEIRRNFFAERKEFFNQRNAEIKEAVARKNELIEKAKEYAANKNFSKEITEKMKELDVAWKAIGFAGKENNDRLWEEFKAAKNEFWDAKREDNTRRFQEIIDRKNETIKNLRNEIEELEIKEYETENFDTIRSYQRRAEEKKEMIDSLQKDIEDLQSRLSK